MKLSFKGMLLEQRPAKDKNGNVKAGAFKLRFFDIDSKGEFEVNSSAMVPADSEVVPMEWVLEVAARVYQGLISLTATAVHGGKLSASPGKGG